MPVTCDYCGTTAPEGAGDALPLAWATAVENGRTRVFCERCARENLRAIESKLDSQWW